MKTQHDRRTQRTGFTLIEIVIASALFMMLSLVMFSLFRYGLLGTSKGQMQTEAQQDCAEIVSRIKSDLQASAPFQCQLPNTDSNGNPWPVAQSAVLMPSVETPGGGVIDPQHPNDGYPIMITPLVPAQRDPNELFFTRSSSSDIGSANMNQTGSYILVRYAVYPASAPKYVLRKTYSFNTAVTNGWIAYDNNETYPVSGTTVLPVGGDPQWYYIVRSKLPAPIDPNDPANKPTATETAWQPIVQLTGPNDLLTFCVSHRLINNNHANVTPSYDPFHFVITAAVDMFSGSPKQVITDLDDPNQQLLDPQNDHVYRVLQDEITLPQF